MSETCVPESTPAVETPPHPRNQGQFTHGNPGGPGNPFARRSAQIKAIVHEVCDDEGIRRGIEALFVQFQQGDLAVAKLLLPYLIGKPGQEPNHDQVNIQEWEILKKQSTMRGELAAIIDTPHPSVVLDAINIMQGVKNPVHRKEIADGVRNGLPAEHTRAEREARRQAKMEARKRREELLRARQLSDAEGERQDEIEIQRRMEAMRPEYFPEEYATPPSDENSSDAEQINVPPLETVLSGKDPAILKRIVDILNERLGRSQDPE